MMDCLLAILFFLFLFDARLAVTTVLISTSLVQASVDRQAPKELSHGVLFSVLGEV